MKEALDKLGQISDSLRLRQDLESLFEHYTTLIITNEDALNNRLLSYHSGQLLFEVNKLAVKYRIKASILLFYFSLDVKLYPILRNKFSSYMNTLEFKGSAFANIPDWAKFLDGSHIEYILQNNISEITSFLNYSSHLLPDSTRNLIEEYAPLKNKEYKLEQIENDFQKQILKKQIGQEFDEIEFNILLMKFNHIKDFTTSITSIHHLYCIIDECFSFMPESHDILKKISNKYLSNLSDHLLTYSGNIVSDSTFKTILPLLIRDQHLTRSLCNFSIPCEDYLDLTFLLTYCIVDKNLARELIDTTSEKLGESFPTGTYSSFPKELKMKVFYESYKQFLIHSISTADANLEVKILIDQIFQENHNKNEERYLA